MELDATTVVLVGGGGRHAVEALAERQGRDASQRRASPSSRWEAPRRSAASSSCTARCGQGLELTGLCDVQEEDEFRRGLERAGLGSNRTRPTWSGSASTSASGISRTS